MDSPTFLVGKLRGIRRRAERFLGQDGRGFVGPVTTAALDVHREHDIGPSCAEKPHEVADDLLPPPALVDLGRAERVAVVDRAGEPLLRAVETVGGEQLGGAKHSHVLEQLGSDFILPPGAPRCLDIDRAQALTEREHRVQLIVLVVRMSRCLQECAADHIQSTNRQAEGHVTVVRRNERDEARLCLQPGLSGRQQHEGHNGEGNQQRWKVFHGPVPMDDS